MGEKKQITYRRFINKRGRSTLGLSLPREMLETLELGQYSLVELSIEHIDETDVIVVKKYVQ